MTDHELGALTALVQTARGGGWWQQYGDLIDEQFRESLALESAASEILLFNALQVPDLLQTVRYARAVACAGLSLPPVSAPKCSPRSRPDGSGPCSDHGRRESWR